MMHARFIKERKMLRGYPQLISKNLLNKKFYPWMCFNNYKYSTYIQWWLNVRIFVYIICNMKNSNINGLNDSYLLLTILSYTCLCPAPSSFLFSCLLSHVRNLHHEQAEKKNIEIMAEDEHQIHKVNVSFYSVRLITFFIQISRSLLAAPFQFSDEETETVISGICFGILCK